MFIAPTAGAPMRSIEEIELIAHLGISGDRYANGLGAFSNTTPAKMRDVTLITQAGITQANDFLSERHHPQFTAAETRRNILIDGMTPLGLNQLVGITFQLGGLKLLGVELCEPCQRPALLTKKMNFMEAFANCGGIRASVLDSGKLFLGDRLTLL